MDMLDYKRVLNFLSVDEIKSLEPKANDALNLLLSKNGEGSSFTGWVNYPNVISDDELDNIVAASNEIKDNSKVLLVIGIGGSYLGAKAAINMIKPYIRNKEELEVIFVGNSLSSTHMVEVLNYLDDKDFSINVISKSGTTTEPAVAFRIFKNLLIKKYGTKYNERIYVTTTIGSGALYNLAVKNKYKLFSIPKDIGGRYSVLTPVGLLPMACCSIDIKEVINGAKKACLNYTTKKFMDNDALLYAAIRNILYKKGKVVEILALFEPKLYYLGEWYKQLFGESEGKDLKGIFPATVTYSTDLHSIGQYIQDGSRMIFETFVKFKHAIHDLNIEVEETDFDGLNYLTSMTIDEINQQAMKGTVLAHIEGGVPSIIIELEKLDAYNFGYFVYFMMLSCGVSGYLLEVNPFNQDGVEAYKNNMFALLGKKGYEELREDLLKKL